MAEENERRLHIGRRFSLATVGEGWEDCYVLYRPATPADKTALRTAKLADVTPDAAQQQFDRFMGDHFVGGQVLVGDVRAEMQPSDLAELPDDVMAELYFTIMGLQYDPKDSRTSTATSSTVPPGNEPATEANSSPTS